MLFQYIQRYFINDSLYDYKDILLEDMAKKDIEFYDLYKTGELLEKLRNAERVYDKNMEELSEETTRNLKEEKNDEKMNSKNVLLRRESTLENADFESEEEKLKKSNINYSKSQLIVKSMKVSLLNWKFILYTRFTSIFFAP